MMRPYAEVLIEIKNAIEAYRNGVNYLKLYLTNPDTVAGEVIKLGDEILTKSFEDISKGLKGEFTRQKAVSLGARTISAYLIRKGNDIIAGFEERDNYIKAGVKLIKDTYFSSTENMNLEMLVKRRDIYKETEQLSTFFTNRAEDKLSSQVLADLGTSESLNNYLTRYVNIMLEIKKTCPLTDLEQMLVNYQTDETVLTTLEKNNVDSPTADTTGIEGIKVVDITGESIRALALKFLRNTTVVTTKDTLVGTFDDLINELPLTLQSLTANIKILDLMDTKFPSCIDNVKLLISNANTDVEKFSKSIISFEDIDKSININIGRVINRFNAAVTFDGGFLFSISKFGRQVYNVDSVYVLLDKATLHGILPE